MSEAIIWLFAFVALYWTYCLYWGVRSARLARTSDGLFIADRALPAWVFVLGATAASFGGWIFLGHPSLIFRDGLSYSELSLCAVAIPLTGVVFLKRQWMLGRRFGYVTAGDLFADYFQSEALRALVLVIALVFAVPFVGMQLAASGDLIGLLSGGAVDPDLAMWVLAFVAFLYVCFGGMRAAAYVNTLQALLFGGGIAAVGFVAYGRLGGFGELTLLLGKLGASATGPFGVTAQGYNAALVIPGVVEFTAGLGREAPVGGIWTATMILTYGFALMGIQAGPLFTTWAFSVRSPKGFAPQQVWASAASVGLLLLFFAVATGMAARLLGSPSSDVNAAHLTSLFGAFAGSLAHEAPWFTGLLAVSALAAIQALAAGYAVTAGTMLARDLYQQHVEPAADDQRLRLLGRIGIGVVVCASLLLASFAPVAQARLGALALGFGAQLWPALLAICWVRWFTREGVLLGLVAGMVAVTLTEPLGAALAAFFGVALPWGRWPWTIHSAGWGIVCNVAVVLIVSALTQGEAARAHRARFHDFLREHASLGPDKRGLRTVAWSLALAWLFFAIGPGAVLGNDIFGPPNGGVGAWALGIPSLWAWQILWWGLGVLLIWFLAYKMELSTAPRSRIEPLPASLRRVVRRASISTEAALRMFWVIAAACALVATANWLLG